MKEEIKHTIPTNLENYADVPAGNFQWSIGKQGEYETVSDALYKWGLEHGGEQKFREEYECRFDNESAMFQQIKEDADKNITFRNEEIEKWLDEIDELTSSDDCMFADTDESAGSVKLTSMDADTLDGIYARDVWNEELEVTSTGALTPVENDAPKHIPNKLEELVNNCVKQRPRFKIDPSKLV
jgi:hypothetical protein